MNFVTPLQSLPRRPSEPARAAADPVRRLRLLAAHELPGREQLAYWKSSSPTPRRCNGPAARPFRVPRPELRRRPRRHHLAKNSSIASASWPAPTTPRYSWSCRRRCACSGPAGATRRTGHGHAGGRTNHRDPENLIGFFLNTLVLRTRIAEEQTFHDLIDRRGRPSGRAPHGELPSRPSSKRSNP